MCKYDSTIKITDDLVFGYSDLMTEVDFKTEFTLKQLINACMRSEIPIEVLCQIAQCNYIPFYWEESRESSPDPDRGIEYLQVSWWGTKHNFKGKREDGSGWTFDGIGEAGVVCDDIKEHMSEEEVEKLQNEGYRQAYAIELTHISKLADYVIKKCQKISITDYDAGIHKDDEFNKEIDMIPSISLVELIYSVFYELSFFGGPEERDLMKEDLVQRVKDIKDGTAETVPWEEVKERLSERLNIDLDEEE